MAAHIICLGNSTLDRVWPVAELPAASGKYRATDYLEVGGGMAANAAVAAARLGGAVAYWGRGGDDAAGHAMQTEMAAYGVDVTHYRLFPGARSATAAVLVASDGERLIVNFRGAGLPDATDWLPLDRVRGNAAVLADIRWSAGACALFAQARTLSIPTVLDAESAEAPAFATVLPLTDHAIFSEVGLQTFSGSASLKPMQYSVVLERARKLGCRVAAVTRGAHGITWLDDFGCHHQPAFAVEVVDTTGAGDVFHGAYALALAESQPVAAAMRFASGVAALKCTKPGGRAGLPNRTEINAFLAQNPNKR